MQAYIALAFSQRETLSSELDAIKQALQVNGIRPFVFVNEFHFRPEEEQEMMKEAFACIDRSGLLIAEGSEKAIGIGIEAGYAKAKGIPVIYLRSIDAAHSTTLSGTSDHAVYYKNALDLQEQLGKTLFKLIP